MRSFRPQTSNYSDPRLHRRGIVLVLVLIVVVMVSLSGFSFVATMLHENKAVHIRGEQLQMDYALDSAEEYLKRMIERPPSSSELTRPGSGSISGSSSVTPLEDELLMRGVVVIDDEPKGRVRFTVMAPRYEESDSSKWSYGLVRESSRLDLQAVMDWEMRRPGAGRLALMQLPGMTESTADALLDWMDVDQVARQSGAEDEYYATLNPPYTPRNGLPESLEELLLVKGVTRMALFGDDTDQNHRVQWNERQSSQLKGERERMGENHWPWAELLTLYSGERNQTRDGQSRIDLNEPSLVRLHAQMKASFDVKLATFVVLYRQYGPITSSIPAPGPTRTPAETGPAERNEKKAAASTQPAKGPAASVAGPASDLALIQPNFSIAARFTIRSPMDLIESQVQIPPVAGNSGRVISPLPAERDLSLQALTDLCDRLTAVTSPVLRGRINVNLAPAAVLRTIPGLDPALADQIVAARTAKGSQNQDRDASPGWLLMERIVSLAQLKELYPYLTTGGDVYRAQIIAFSEASRLSQRVEIVLDGTVSPARRLLRNDLQVLGRGFPWDVLDTPAGIANTGTGVTDATPARH